MDDRILRCIQATEDFLDGALGEDDLLEGRRAAGAVVAPGAAIGPDTGRATAAAHSADGHYLAQNADLRELIAGSRARRV